METAESRSRAVGTELEQEVARLEVGFWTPAGSFLRDDLFPHVKGNFRRRVIPVASVHVSKTRSLEIRDIIDYQIISILIAKYPPWQVLTKDSRGKVVGRSGLIFEILDQISYKVTDHQ